MIISQGMCKGPGPWQVSGRPYFALWFPCHPWVRSRIRDDWRYAPSPSTSALSGICQQTRQGKEFWDVLQNGLSRWLEKKETMVTKNLQQTFPRVCFYFVEIYYIFFCLCLDPEDRKSTITFQQWTNSPTSQWICMQKCSWETLVYFDPWFCGSWI